MSGAKPNDEPPADSTGTFIVTGGGVPTTQELAAIIVALTPVVAAEESGQRARPASAWREASLLEGVGFRPFVSVDDVERYHRSLA